MEDIVEAIRLRLIDARKKAQKKQIGGGAYGEIPQSTISTWEKKGPPEQLLTLRQLVQRYHTNANYLLMLTDDNRPHGNLSEQITVSVEDPQEREMLKEAIDALSQASIEDKEYIVGLIRRLAPKKPRIIGGE